jgi:hypothetical protein
MVESVQKCLALTEMGSGLMNRIYFMKSKLVGEKRNIYMGPDYLHRFRVMITQNFPKVPSRKKLKEIPGGEAFASNAVNNCRVLSSYRDLVYDMVDFAVNSAAVLTSMPKTSVLHSHFERNREVVQCYLDLLKTYMRVMIFFSTMKEGKTLYALYAASVHYLHHSDEHSKRMSLGGHSIEKKYTENASTLFSHMEDTSRHFVDAFNADLAQFLKSMLLNMRVTLWAGEDLYALEARKVFDPVNATFTKSSNGSDGAHDAEHKQIDRNVLDTQPVAMTLNTESTLDLYSELCSLQAYKESVVFACLAAPSLMLEPDILDLLRHVIEHTMVLPIFRDFNLMIHRTLEDLALAFPDPALDPLITVPKGYKLKTTLKHIARHATMTCAHYHVQRRTYLTAVLARVHSLIQQSPGLVGPKMPLITAVASLAREEVLWYYRHLGKVKIRKDCKKFHDPSLYVAYDIAELVGELCRLTTAVRQHQKIIINYYSEYLSGSHFKKLISLLETVSQQIDARLKDYPEGTGPLSDQDNKDELRYLKSIMNPMVEDLVRATTMFSQRPDFRAIHENTKGNGTSSDAANPAHGSNEEKGDANTEEGFDMHLYRMHPDDRALTKELRVLATDPLGGAAGVGGKLLKHDSAMQPGPSDVPLITGDVERLGSLRRNWLAAEDHLNRALEILTLAQKDEQENVKKSDASTVNTRRKDTLRALLSASKLITHMRVLVNHSMFVDSLPVVYEHYFEPHDVWWFRDSFVDSFYDCIEGDSEDGREAKFALAYMWIPSLSARSLHADCPQEAAPMAKAAILVAETMIEDFLTHFGDQFHALCEKVDGLKQQVAPIEAGNRLERMLSAKEEEDAGGETRVAEPYPGFESHPDHKSSIHEHALIKGNVVHLIATANEFGQIQVHDRYYTLPSALVGRAADSIRAHFIPTFFSGFEHSDLNPISDAYRSHKSAIAAFKLITRYADLHESHERSEELYSGGGNDGGNHGTGRSKFFKGAGAMVPLATMDGEGTAAGTAATSHHHHATAGTTFDMGRWYRDLLFSQSSDPCVPFPGTHLPTDMKVGGVNLAWQYSIWFAGMASQIASGRSGLVYLPQVNAIGTLSVVKDVKTQYSVRQSRRKSQTQKHHRGSVETLAYDEEEEGEEKVAATSFLTVGEISSMCRLMGPHGIRTIDTQLLRIMTFMVNTDVRAFLAENEKPLRRLTTRCREKGVLRGVHKDLKGLHRLCDALTTIGFIIVLRRMLYQAQGDVLSSLSPSIADILKSVASVIDPLEAPRGGCAAAADIVSLAGAYGSTTAVDMPVLIALERQCFDPCPVFDKQRVKPAPTSVNFQGSYVSGGVGGGGGRRASVISELSDNESERPTSVRVDVDFRDSRASERTKSMNRSMSSQMYSVSSASPKAFYRSLTSGAAGADGSGTKSTRYIDEWELMPAALASVYLSDLWEHTHYYSAHNAFSHNEHLLPEAISALLLSSMGCDGYAQYLHILKTEQENVAARAAELRSRNNNSPGKGSKGGDDGDGDSDDDESGGANTEVESRRASAATLASASAASIGSKLAKTASTGEYIAAEHAVTNRSLIKDHLKAQTESFLCMTSSILLWVQGRGRLSAQRIMSDAMQSLGGEAETHHMTNNDCDTSAQDSKDLDGALFMGFSRKPVKKAEDAKAAAVAAASAAAARADSSGGSAEEKSNGRGASSSPPRPAVSSSHDDGKKAGSGKSATTPSKKDGKSSGKGKSKKQDKEAGSDSEEDEDVEDKEGDLEDFSMRPVPAMASTLEKFVWLCPVASRSMLESYYPYSLIHTGLSEAALGKLRELDERRPYADKK